MSDPKASPISPISPIMIPSLSASGRCARLAWWRERIMTDLVDSAGARITDQVDMFPGRRGAGRIFRTQIQASGSIPQVCALFGPTQVPNLLVDGRLPP